MKGFLFVPDFNKKSGLGHLHRCLKYSHFVNKKYKIIFLIQKRYKKKISEIKFNKKIQFFFFKKLENSLKTIKKKYENFSVFVDSYSLKILNTNYKKFAQKYMAILDNRMKTDADQIINHTFGLNNNFYNNLNNKKKISVGLKNFPITDKIKSKKKDTILINFGSTNDILLIKKSLTFLNKLNLNRNFKTVIISKFYTNKNIDNVFVGNKIKYFKYVKKINKIYEKTFFSFGACGISLYEKSFFKIPTIAVCAAKNQRRNFKNFYSKDCILNFNKIIKIKLKNKNSKDKFLNNLNNVKKNLNKYFIINKNIRHLKNIFKNC